MMQGSQEKSKLRIRPIKSKHRWRLEDGLAVTKALCFLKAAGDEPLDQGRVLHPRSLCREQAPRIHLGFWQTLPNKAPLKQSRRGGSRGKIRYKLLRLWRHQVRALGGFFPSLPTPTGSLTGTKSSVKAPLEYFRKTWPVSQSITCKQAACSSGSSAPARES